METLTVLGASARAAAQSVRRAGRAPWCIDCYADRDCTALGPAVKIARYPHDFMAALAAAPQAPWLYTGGLENYPRLVDRLADIRPLLGNRGRALLRARDPMVLKVAADRAGLPFPPTVIDCNQVDLKQDKWLIKAKRSSGGVNVRVADERGAARLTRNAHFQQYIEGEPASAVFVAAGARATLLGTTRQLIGRDLGLPAPFLYIGSVGPLSLADDELARVRTLADVVAREVGLIGLFNIDFVRNPSGLWPLEINPRYSASVEVIERFTGVAAIDLHVAACAAGDLPRSNRALHGRCAGKAVVYARRDGITPAALDELIEQWNIPGQPPRLADLPRVGETVKKDQPVLTIIAEGDSLAAVESQLRRDVAAVHDLFQSNNI